jgi:hypothetical protein
MHCIRLPYVACALWLSMGSRLRGNDVLKQAE